MRKHILSASLIAVIALTMDSSIALSEEAIGVPSCVTSIIDGPVGRSPTNLSVPPLFAYTYKVTLLDALGAPVVGFPAAFVTLTIGAPCANPAVITPVGPSDATGLMVWSVASLDFPGGSCAGPAFITIAVVPPCVIPIPYVTGPDEDGNGVIGLPDLARFRATFVNFPAGAVWDGDMNRDTRIGLADLAFFQQHFIAQ